MIRNSGFLLVLLLLTLFHQILTFPSIERNGKNTQQQSTDVSSSSLKMKDQPELLTTIEQVEKILASDPTLPRLTRGEIADLYEQVAREEYEKSRSLMLVLPYNTDNIMEENLQELYTRPPVTKVIESYSLPHPQKFPNATTTTTTTESSNDSKIDIIQVDNVDVTTFKSSFHPTKKPEPSPTTYHPSQPIYRKTTAAIAFQPIINNYPLPIIDDEASRIEKPQLRKPSSAQRFSSHYSAKDTQFSKINQKKTSTTEFANILHSLGISPQRQTPKLPQIIESYNVAESAPKPVFHHQFRPFDAATVAAVNYQNLMPKVNTDAYKSFRPLNIGEEIRVNSDVEDYLTRFGILSGRSQKSMDKGGNSAESNDTLGETTTISSKEEINNITRSRLTTTTTTASIESTKRSDNFQTKIQLRRPQRFHRRIDTNIENNPIDLKSEESQKLIQFEKLISNLEELQHLNISLRPEMVKKTQPHRQNGLDPIAASNESGEQQKTDIQIKRQSEMVTPEPSSTQAASNNDDDLVEVIAVSQPTRFNLNLNLDTVDTSSSVSLNNEDESKIMTTTTTTTTESNTEESRNGALSDLEDSFGGPNPNTESALPPKKKNGFYFLADWNSFLEVGQDDDQVVVRFSPKIGDPRLFIPVTVP